MPLIALVYVAPVNLKLYMYVVLRVLEFDVDAIDHNTSKCDWTCENMHSSHKDS